MPLTLIKQKETKKHQLKQDGVEIHTFQTKAEMKELVKKLEAVINEKRSGSQNRSMWLFCSLLAKAFNDAGYTIQMVLKLFKLGLNWNKDSVMDIIWRPIQEALFKKKSTTKLKKMQEIDSIYEHINRFTAKMGIHVPFPAKCLSCSHVECQCN